MTNESRTTDLVAVGTTDTFNDLEQLERSDAIGAVNENLARFAMMQIEDLAALPYEVRYAIDVFHRTLLRAGHKPFPDVIGWEPGLGSG